MRNLTMLTLAAACACATALHADVTAYWAFDDRAPGLTATTLVTSANAPDLNGTGHLRRICG